MRHASSMLVPFAALALLAADALAVPTEITVRVLAKDAKFIGSDMGGVRVTVSDAETGEVLAQGVVAGGVGDTTRIMEEPRKRGVPLATEDAAAFHATIDLERPRRIEVSAFGPLIYPAAANRVSATQWVVPGKHITAGDGWLLEMPGFFVQITPPLTKPYALRWGKAVVPLRARVVLMCGCPTTPDGVWDANDYEIEAMLMRAGKVVARTPLRHTGNASEYGGELTATEPGAYEAIVYAYDAATGNTGVAQSSVLVVD